MPHARWLRLAVALLALCPCVPAQDMDGVGGAETIRKDVNEVNLTFTVVDGKGRFVNGLTQENFSILDNNRPPASVKRFQSLTDLPLRICIAIDTSDSISHYVKFQQEVAIRFLKDVLRPGVDQACLIKFASSPVLAQAFTDDIGKLEAGIRTAQSNGATAVWDAVRYTSDLLHGHGSSDHIRRVIVLLTDGEDNQSTTTFDDLLENVLRAEVAVEVVDTIEVPSAVTLLHKLANATGGHLWAGASSKQLAASLARIEQSLRSEYFVAYEPAGELAPGRFRKIQVKARKKKGKLAYRTGYFVPKRESPLAADSDPR